MKTEIIEMVKIDLASEHYAHNFFNMHETNNYKALKQGFKAGVKWHQKESNEILNQLLDDVEKHGTKLVREHLNYYIKQLNKL